MVSIMRTEVKILPVTAMVDGIAVNVGEVVVPVTNGFGGEQIGEAEVYVNDNGDIMASVELNTPEGMNFSSMMGLGLTNALSISTGDGDKANRLVEQNKKDKKEKKDD